MHGIIPVYKEKGMTSHDVVNHIRRLTGIRKVGHTGTLDPGVEGVLPICIGQATRVAEYIQSESKQYQGSMLVGVATDTEDQHGTVIDRVNSVSLTREQIEDACLTFIGEIEQTPPMYSAVKKDGKRLYELARQGKTVDRMKRKVIISELTCTGWEPETYPTIHFQVVCSKGTYIRTLCVDIGKKLGYPAHMVSLYRTGSGCFRMEDCYTLSQLNEVAQAGNWKEVMVGIDEVLGQYPSLILPADSRAQIHNGCYVECEDELPDAVKLVRIYTEQGNFCALYRKLDNRVLKPEKVFREVE